MPMFQAAHDALSEYGGLKVTQEGIPKGMDESRCLLDLNPELLMHEVWRIGSAELVLGYTLYPIGKLDHERVSSHLYIDEQGGVYFWKQTALTFLAPSLRAALECFILGRWPAQVEPKETLDSRPEALPEEQSLPKIDIPAPYPAEHFVTRLLEQAGWYPGRREDAQVEAWSQLFERYGLPMFQAAHDALLEYGGLQVIRKDDPAGVHEIRCPFELNPELLMDEVVMIGSSRLALGCTLYPIGKVHTEISTACIYIDAQGRVYFDWKGGFAFVAPSLRKALGCFILERWPVHYQYD